jgi:hypothetical protein
MTTVSGYIRTENMKIWFWISCWDDAPLFEVPLAA